jgi:thioredoxin-related protein
MKHIACILLALFILNIDATAQIDFEKKSWDAVIKKAKKQNKYIFVDCYTTWCGPCKLMDKKTFQDRQVGAFYNENFISYKIDMESTEGLDFSQYFLASVYPTFFFLDPNGNTVLKTVGYQEAEAFIQTGKQALQESIKKEYGAIDIAKEKMKEADLQRNKYFEFVKSAGYEMELREWEQILQDAKSNNRNIIGIVGDTHWPIHDALRAEETKKLLQENFEITAISFTQSYLKDENGEYVKDENDHLVLNDWMTKYQPNTYPGVVFINPDGELLISGGQAETAQLAQGVLDGLFKPEVGFWPSIEGTGWVLFKEEQLDKAFEKAARDGKDVLVLWHRTNANVLPVYENKEIISALNEKFVVATVNGKSEELRKKYAGDTYGLNGALSVLGQDGSVKKAVRIAATTTKEELLSILNDGATEPKPATQPASNMMQMTPMTPMQTKPAPAQKENKQ